MADDATEIREEVFRTHRACARPPSAGEVLVAATTCVPRTERPDLVEIVRADFVALGVVFGAVPTVGRYAALIDPNRCPDEAREVAHQVMCAVPCQHHEVANAIAGRYPAWSAVIDAAARAATAVASGRHLDELPAEIGSTLPCGSLRFEILGFLGTGASSDVAIARDRLLGPAADTVAVKFVWAPGSQEYARLCDEARRASAARHPCGVAVLDVGRAESGLGYIAFERVRGEPLTAFLASERAVAAEHACNAIAELADAIAMLHGHGTSHGDISLANVLLDEDGRLRLIDFGIGGTSSRDAIALDCVRLAELLEVLLSGFVRQLDATTPDRILGRYGLATTLGPTLRVRALALCERVRRRPSDMPSLAADLRRIIEISRVLRLAAVLALASACIASAVALFQIAGLS